MSPEKRSGRGGGQKISPWEWVAAAIGGVLVFGTIAFMLHEVVTGSDRPIAVEMTVDTIVADSSSYLVQFTARNTGDATAADLQIVGELLSDTVVVATATTTIDYLPQRGSRSAGLFFDLDPRAYTLELRPIGHDVP